jgi:hypothetical protein
MEIKKYLIKHDLIWSRIRLLERKVCSRKADSMHYITSNRIASAEYKKKQEYYLNKKKKLCDEIRQYEKTMPRYKSNREKTYIEPERLFMISNIGDQMGKVFSYKGEIYRGVYKENMEDFLLIWNKGVLQVLGKQRLIPEITISEYCTDEFPLILHSKKVCIQKNTMWSYAMVKEACILVSFLNDLLHEFKLTLLDGHLNNVTFDKNRPIFVDIGSIIPYRPTGVQEELVFGGIFRLLFGYLGNCMLYRLPSHDNDNNNIFIQPRFYNQMTREYRFCLSEFKKYHWLHGNSRGRNIVHKIFDLYTVMPWDIDVLFPVIKENIGITLGLPEWENLSEESIVDVGGGAGIIKLALREGALLKEVKFLDFKEKRLDETYNQFKSFDVKSFFALYNYIYVQNNSCLHSLKADTVLCVDPLKDNASFHGININTIAYSLSKLGEKKVIVVFTRGDNDRESETERFRYCLEKYYLIKEYFSSDKTYSYWIGKRK